MQFSGIFGVANMSKWKRNYSRVNVILEYNIQKSIKKNFKIKCVKVNRTFLFLYSFKIKVSTLAFNFHVTIW